MPLMQPSSSPTFDPRSTLEIVQRRGNVRCGVDTTTFKYKKGLRVDLCRSIASVLLGNADSFVLVPMPPPNSFQMLHNRDVDVLVARITHTIEREVQETSTMAGFTFSSPYYYDGLAYFGNKTLVECAEKEKRYDECSSLYICVLGIRSTSYRVVKSLFPSDFYQLVSSRDEFEEVLWSGACNVMAWDKSELLDLESSDKNRGGKFSVGHKKLIENEPQALITRNGDREFSDILNWVLQALFYGEEQGLTKNQSLCQKYSNENLTSLVQDLDFLNAVHCVGNYGDIFDGDKNNRGMNQINDGTTGMLYVTPFGELSPTDDKVGIIDAFVDETRLGHIRDEGSLNCGVVVPYESIEESTARDKVVEMSIDFCRTLAAALFNGNFKAVTVTPYLDNDSSPFVALGNGTIDVLSGARVEQNYEFDTALSLGGFHFSTPYYYGKETG